MSLSPLQETDSVLQRGEIHGFGNDGAPLVRRADDQVVVECDVLAMGGQRMNLARGDVVSLWCSGRAERAVIIGRITVAGAPDVACDREACHLHATGVPDELVLEAKHSLTLRVGDGSITIREDGKILIKGKDLVSHATRLNRIKGGAVQIN